MTLASISTITPMECVLSFTLSQQSRWNFNKNPPFCYNNQHTQVVTVNCARIIHGNQVATNGVVHVIDRVISAVGNTIQDVIEVDDDLSTLNVSTNDWPLKVTGLR